MAKERSSEADLRSVRNEAAYFSVEPGDLIERLRAAQYSNQVAQSIAAWVIVKKEGRTDRTSSPTRACYRRILATLDAATLDRVVPG